MDGLTHDALECVVLQSAAAAVDALKPRVSCKCDEFGGPPPYWYIEVTCVIGCVEFMFIISRHDEYEQNGTYTREELINQLHDIKVGGNLFGFRITSPEIAMAVTRFMDANPQDCDGCTWSLLYNLIKL